MTARNNGRMNGVIWMYSDILNSLAMVEEMFFFFTVTLYENATLIQERGSRPVYLERGDISQHYPVIQDFSHPAPMPVLSVQLLLEGPTR